MSLFDLLSGTLDGVFAVDRQQRIAFWNEPAARILGFDARSMLGRPCYEALGGMVDDRGCTICSKSCAAFQGALRGGLSPTREALVRTASGADRWINVSTFVIPAAWHELSLLAHVFRDISEARQIELRLARVLAEAPEPAAIRDAPPPHEPLTRRELEVLRLLASGASTAMICSVLAISQTTVRTHVQHILSKLRVHSRLEAAAVASHIGLLAG